MKQYVMQTFSEQVLGETELCNLPQCSADGTVHLSILWEAVERGSGGAYHVGHCAVAAGGCAVVEVLTDVRCTPTSQRSPNTRLSLLSGTAKSGVSVLLFLLGQKNIFSTMFPPCLLASVLIYFAVWDLI